jgi:hypothetical protein
MSNKGWRVKVQGEDAGEDQRPYIKDITHERPQTFLFGLAKMPTKLPKKSLAGLSCLILKCLMMTNRKARCWDWLAMPSKTHRQVPTQKQKEVSFLFALASSAGICFEF